jgi:hypothetical protein
MAVSVSWSAIGFRGFLPVKIRLPYHSGTAIASPPFAMAVPKGEPVVSYSLFALF